MSDNSQRQRTLQFFVVVAIVVAVSVFSCSEKSDQSQAQEDSVAAVKHAKLVYYALPG